MAQVYFSLTGALPKYVPTCLDGRAYRVQSLLEVYQELLYINLYICYCFQGLLLSGPTKDLQSVAIVTFLTSIPGMS